MPRKVLFFIFICFLFISFSLYAANVSVIVIETGIPKENPVNRFSQIWENGLMEMYFESGHIVTNSPILRLNEKPEDKFPEDALRSYEEAKETGMDFFVAAIIEYSVPFKVSLRLFSTKSTEMIYETSFTDIPALSERDRYERIKRVIHDTSERLW